MIGKTAIVKNSSAWWWNNRTILIEKEVKKGVYKCGEIDSRQKMIFYSNELEVKN